MYQESWGIRKLTLQLDSALSNELAQILKVITRCDAKAANKVLGCALQISISIINWRKLIFGPAEIVIARDGGGTIELTEAILGLGLSSRVKSFPSEEFIGRDTLLGAESSSSLR